LNEYYTRKLYDNPDSASFAARALRKQKLSLQLLINKNRKVLISAKAEYELQTRTSKRCFALGKFQLANSNQLG